MSTHTVLAAVLASGLLAACSKPEPVAEVPRPVMAHTLAPAQVAPVAFYTGEVRARYESDLAFRIGGKVVERRVDVGAVVKPGDVLARLDPADAGLNAEAAQAQLAAADNELAYARAELLRYRDLVARNFVSRSVLDAKETAFRSASARVEQARAQAGVAGRQAGYTRLVADQPGVVTAVFAEVGQVVKDATVVMKLAREGEREVLIAVPETRIAELKKAGRVEVRLWTQPDVALAGRVREIAPSADAASRTYAVRVSIVDPAPALQLGMTANVSLADAAPGGLLVPSTAVFEQGGASSVWVLQPEGELVRPVLRPVTVRQFREDGVLVSAGLKAGETIAAAGVHKIVAGQALRPVAAQAAARSGAGS
ncbi:efflux RND transporter periplasmic adaptor subunit [Zoogloea sp.]|uniref:efflux RND transporter periplasmic adaptor subunit n=1 Tax=Zoogloea sp. TaxID=49181 RepID=UPI0035B069E7